MSESSNTISGGLGSTFVQKANPGFDAYLEQAARMFKRGSDKDQLTQAARLLVQASEEGTSIDERIDCKLKAADLLETVPGINETLSLARDLRWDVAEVVDDLSARQATTLMEQMTRRIEGEKALNYGDRSQSQMVDLLSRAAQIVVADRGASAGCADRLYSILPPYSDFPGGEDLVEKMCDRLYPYLNDENRFERLCTLQGAARLENNSD